MYILFMGFQADWPVSRISIGTAESEHGWSLPRDLLCSQSSSLYPLWRSFSVQLLRVVPSSLASCSDSAKLHRSLRVPRLVVGLRCFETARQGRKIKIGHTGQTAKRCRCDAKFSLASNVVACFSFQQSLLARRAGVQQQLRHLDRAVAELNQLKPVAQPWQLSKCSEIGGEATDLLHRVAYFLLDQVLQVFILLIGHGVTIRRSRRMICHLQSITSMIIWYSILTLIFVCPLTVSLFYLMILDCKWVIRLRCSSKCQVDGFENSWQVDTTWVRTCRWSDFEKLLWSPMERNKAAENTHILPVCCILYWRFPGHAARRCPCRACVLQLIWLWTSCRKDQKAQSNESKWSVNTSSRHVGNVPTGWLKVQ